MRVGSSKERVWWLVSLSSSLRNTLQTSLIAPWVPVSVLSLAALGLLEVMTPGNHTSSFNSAHTLFHSLITYPQLPCWNVNILLEKDCNKPREYSSSVKLEADTLIALEKEQWRRSAKCTQGVGEERDWQTRCKGWTTSSLTSARSNILWCQLRGWHHPQN